MKDRELPGLDQSRKKRRQEEKDSVKQNLAVRRSTAKTDRKNIQKKKIGPKLEKKKKEQGKRSEKWGQGFRKEDEEVSKHHKLMEEYRGDRTDGSSGDRHLGFRSWKRNSGESSGWKESSVN